MVNEENTIMAHIVKNVDNENPEQHWEFINCENKVAVDLGCGRWEKVEFRDQSWPTTPEYLILRGASHVYAFDIDPEEISWYSQNISPKFNVTATLKRISSVEDIKEIYQTYKPKIVKCDIEGAEESLLHLSNEEFCSVDLYAIETHSDFLFDRFMSKFAEQEYQILGVINLVHAPPMKAIFAKKK